MVQAHDLSSLQWSGPLIAAIEQLGATGKILGRCDPILRWLRLVTLAALAFAIIARLTR